jgi:uncharacterized protein (TIGR03437 family)
MTDQSAGGTQRFLGPAALAGNPVHLVTGGVLTKWATLGYEMGSAGAPVSDAAAFSTLGANSGMAQSFAGGAIYAATAGPRATQAYFVSGLILARYNALGASGGNYGMPTSDEFVSSAVHQQNFEGGYFTYSPGDAAAVEHPATKTPALIVSPSTALAGSQVQFAIVGFPNNSTITVSVTGQPNFTITTPNGAYTWNAFVPLTAATATTTIQATDAKGVNTASGTLSVRGFNNASVALAKIQGDSQTGPPGALLPVALQIALRDPSGNAVVGAAVTFQASSGAQLTATSSVSDSNGLAQTQVRLPNATGVTLVTANAPGVASAPVTFNLLSAAMSLPNFPILPLAGGTPIGTGTATIAQKGAMLAAVASILRYHQNRSELATPNGTADPASLNQFLTNDCPTSAKGVANCDGYLSNSATSEQVVNLWRAADFTGGADVDIVPPTQSAISDYLAQGSPVLLSLALSLNGAVAGGHFVVATGIAADGSILIQDPNPLFARTGLNDYLSGFTAGPGVWQASLRGIARLALRNPVSTRFLVAAISQPVALMQSLATGITSASGTCGVPFESFDLVDAAGNVPSGGTLLSRMTVCDGSQPAYQLGLGAAQPFQAQIYDLAPGGSRQDLSGTSSVSYKLLRPGFYLVVSSQDVEFTAAAVVNAATFTSGISAGGLISIFGIGLAGPGSSTTIDMDGAPMPVLLASPFQLNSAIPLTVAPGVHTIRVQSAFGSAQQQVTVAVVSPGIFVIGNPPIGAITNANYSLIGSSNPLPRGQAMVIFATGLGAVTQHDQLSQTNSTVSVVLNGTEIPASFAGLAPGFTGLYQVNAVVPVATPPGLSIPLAIKAAGVLSNIVAVSVQ